MENNNVKSVINYLRTKSADAMYSPADVINMLESYVEVEGEWKEVYDEKASMFFHRKYFCSVCNDWNTYGKTEYCPNCGAKMNIKERGY